MLGGKESRLTTLENALNPVWGPKEIVFDRFKRRSGRRARVQPLGARRRSSPDSLRRLTDLTIPPLVSGLVPLEISADGRRLLTVFTGQDTEVGFTVADARPARRARSRRTSRAGIVGFDLSRDGKTILAHTGGPDPANAHDVVTVPYGGGEPKVLVEDAAYPDWTR